MVRVYHSGMPSVPTQTNGVRFNDFLIRLIKACLVTGFGTTPGAGWALEAEAADYIVLRNGPGSGYLCLHLNNQVMTVSMAETYTGVVNGLITGAGAVSGVAASSGVPHRVNRQYSAMYSASSSWYVIADATAAVIGVATSGLTGSADMANASYITNDYPNWTLYVGEDSNGNFIAAGGTASTGTNIVTSAGMMRGFTSLRNPATGLLLAPNALAFSHLGLGRASGNLTPVGTLPVARLCPAQWESGGVYGRLRGVVRCPDIAEWNTSNVGKALGVAGGILSGNVANPINLGDGYTYYAGVLVPSYGEGFLVTNNPEFW